MWYGWVVIGKDICLLGYMFESVFEVGIVLVGVDVMLVVCCLCLVLLLLFC